MTDQHTTEIDDLFLDEDDGPEPPPTRPTSLRRWRILAAVAGVAAIAAIGFAIGRATVDDSGGAAAAGLPEGFVPPGADDGVDTGAQPPTGGFGGGFVNGELVAIDGDEWLITDTSGNTIRVKVTDTTTYRKTETVTADDVAIGEQVTVIGDEQEDGTVDAATVQSGDTGGFGGPPGGFGGGAPPDGATRPTP